MKFYLSFLLVLLFSSFIVKAQCPVIEGAIVKICGANEGFNEAVLFTTTASATAGDYTLYYGDNNIPSLGLPVNILAGANAATATGTGSITTSNGCVINQVTSAATVIPANSKVLFIPAGFDANYDVSAICSSGNVYIVYIDVTSLPSIWNASGVLANTPSVPSYLQVANGAALCSSEIRNYNNNWPSDINGNSVWWDGTGTATYLNNGCSVIAPPVTISNFTATAVCAGTTTTTASYTTTGSPDEYTLLWDATATTAGFADITNASLAGSPLTMVVPSGAGAATYTVSLIVKNSVTGISSVAQNISLTIDPQVTPLFTAIAPICSMDAAPVLPATSTNGITGTWSPATVSNTISGIYTFTPSAGFCATGTSLAVTVVPLPNASIIGNTTICSGTSANIIFNGTPNATVTYNIDGGTNQTIGLNFFGFTIIGTGNLSATTTYNLVSVVNGSCSQPQTGSVTITVLSPVVNLSAVSNTVCSGTGTNITFNGTPDAIVTYNINGGANQTVALDAAGTATVATGNLTADATYNLVSAATTGTLICSQPATGAATVTVNALPTATISGTSAICSGSNTNIIFNGTPNAIVTYNIDGGTNQAVALDAAGTATVITGNLTVATTYNLVSVATSGPLVCSQPVTGAATITIKALPTATISGTIAICSGTSANIIFNGTPNAIVTYNINGGASQTATLDAAGTVTVNSGNLTINTTYNLVSVATAGPLVCSQPATGSAIITINALPTATISGTIAICSRTSTSIVFNGTPNAIVTYNINGGASQTATLDAAGTVTVNSGNCTTNTTYNLVSVATTGPLVCSQPVTGAAIITVNALPTATISGTTVVCYGTGANIIFNGTPNAIVTYNIDGGASQTVTLDAAGTATVATGNLTVGTIYNLVSIATTGTLVCSQPVSGAATITIKALPTASMSGTISICSGTSTNIVFNGTPNAIVTYNANGGASQSATLNAAGTVTVSSGNLTTTTTYNLVSVATGGPLVCSQPVSGTSIVTVNPLPTVIISGSVFICPGGVGNITFNGTPDAIVTYNINGGTSQTVALDAAGAATIATGNLTATTTYNLGSIITTGAFICSQPVAGAAVVTVNPLPTATISGTVSICNGATTNLIFNGTPNATITYTIDGGSNQNIQLDAAGNATMNTGNLLVTTTYDLVSATSAGTPACSQNITGQVIVTVKPVTPLPTVTTPVIYCQNETAIPLTATGTGLLWYTLAAGGAGATIAPTPVTTVGGTTDFYVTQTINLCESQRVPITVIVNPTPDIPTVPPVAIFRCGPGQVTLKASAPGMVKWYADAALTQFIAAGTSYAPTITGTTVFYVTNTEANCVSPARSVTATVFPLVIQVTGFSYNPSTVCAGATKPVPVPVAGFIQGGVYSSTVGLSINGATGVINPALTTPGTYLVKYTLGAAICAAASSSTTSITITKSATPVTAFSYPSPVCTSATNPSPVLTAGFATGGVYSSTTGLSINPATGVIDLKTSTAGTYTVTYTLAVTACVTAGIGKADITITGTPAATVTNGVQRCGNGVVTLNATGTGTVKWYSDAAATNLLVQGTSYSPTISGTTTFYVTNTVGACISQPANIAATVLPITTPVTDFSYTPSTICAGGTKPVPVPVPGFVQGGIYSSITGLSINTATGVIDPAASTPGTYTVKYAVPASLCAVAGSSNTTITISKSIATVTTFSYASPVCISGANPAPVLTTGFTTGGVFSSTTGLSINATTGIIDMATSTAGTYTVTYTVGSTACTTGATSKADITISGVPPAPVTTNNQRCGNGAIVLNATGSGVIKWYADAGLTNLLSQGNSYSPNVAATSTFYVTNSVGNCASPAASIVATVLPVTTQMTDFSYSPSTVCAGGIKPVPVAATGFVQGGIYSSATGLAINSSTGVIDPALSTPGTYVVKYAVAASLCALAGNSTTSITISKSIATVTTFSYASPVCTSGANPSPLLPAGFTTGGVFSSTTGLSINTTTGVIDLAASTAGTYTVTYVVGSTACTTGGSSKADITISTPPTAPVTTSTQRCGNGAVTLNATGTGTIKWYGDAGLTNLLSQGNTYQPGINATTTFYVTTTVGNCVSPAANITATVIPMSVQVTEFSYNPSSVCVGSVKPVPIPATGFVPGGIYSSAAGLSLNSATGAIDPATSTPGTYAVRYTLPAPICAFADNSTTTITISKPATAVTAFSYASPVCTSGGNPSPLLSAGFTTGGVFSSTTGLFINATTGSIDLTKSTAGTYTVIYAVTATPCTNGGSSKAGITISSFLAAPVTKGGQRCGNGGITLSATGTGTLNWYSQPDLKTVIATGPAYTPSLNATTNYYVTEASGTCESVAALVTATVLPIPAKPDLGTNTTLCPGDKFVLQPGRYDNYLWQDNSTSSTFIVTAAGDYSLQVKSANGCTNAASISITPSTLCADILFPTAFSPNGDHLNDNFGPLPMRNLVYVKNYTLRIFNRYGQVVFKSTNPYEKWDGMYLGQLFDTGSFMWQASYIYNDGSTKSQNGYVTIVH